jgi:hypothetical protein
MVSCSSPSTRPPVFTGESDIPPWVTRVGSVTLPSRVPVATEEASPGFRVRYEDAEIHMWLKNLYLDCRTGGDMAVEGFLRALLSEKMMSDFFDRQPPIAAFVSRFVAKVAASTDRSPAIRRLARLILKTFFLQLSECE